MNEPELRQAIIRVCHLLHQKGFVAASDGNVSARLYRHFLVTPSGISKGFLTPDDLVVVDLDGKVIRGKSNRKTTSEWRMHAAIYEERPDANAVVHAHPPLATACSLAGVDLLEPILPEVYLTMGGIPTLPYATPSSPEGARVIREPIKRYDGVILDRHGAIACGKDLYAAYYKIEKIEHTAQVVGMARFLSGRPVRTLDESEKGRLFEVGKAMGLY